MNQITIKSIYKAHNMGVSGQFTIGKGWGEEIHRKKVKKTKSSKVDTISETNVLQIDNRKLQN